MTDEVIDRAALKRLLDVIGGDPDDLAELIEEFETVTPDILETMKSAANAGDIETLRISAHSLKSNGRDFGAIALAQSCEALERDCHDGDVDDPMARVDLIGTLLDAARAALEGATAQSE
jgi:HPt (histidine-containing phosphotransfer) domain-containing protein